MAHSVVGNNTHGEVDGCGVQCGSQEGRLEHLTVRLNDSTGCNAASARSCGASCKFLL